MNKFLGSEAIVIHEEKKSVDASIANEIDTVCDRFESAWNRGARPRIEEFLQAHTEPLRTPLLRELLLLDWTLRCQDGQRPNEAEYCARFPENESLVRQVLSDANLSLERFVATRGTATDPPERDDEQRPAQLPERIGRYRIERVLGKGGFGLVYLARDEQLDRQVAVKIPHAKLVSRPEDAKAYLTEARTVANLDHPHIVTVHDVGSTAECPCYVVSKYIEGTDLAKKLKQQRLEYLDAARLVATVAEALHYAHKQGLVHRDVKPGNILIGNDGQAYVVDFGLALREENIGKGPRYAGTPAYMSPEQARGEGHRVDGRSDIFSLGVVLYELLVGRNPFKGKTRDELFEQVTTYEPRPLRQYDDHIPKELERICHKAMSKRASERYFTAKDTAEDLQHFLAKHSAPPEKSVQSSLDTEPADKVTLTPDSSPAGDVSDSSTVTGTDLSSDNSQPIKIVPKGLRSFDVHDADFFLELLPGPRDRHGLPDSLRFWKTRIEETDADKTFPVGLIYGPSGCGKSSLVKAGLLPNLSDRVTALYVEATADDTETRLLNGLRKHFPRLPRGLSLKDTLAALRRDSGGKVLIVLDQFEQWLHAKHVYEHSELVQSLRQCDGGQVQCLVLVRDDFWLAVSRFMKELEIRLVEGENSSLVDLFDQEHARKILRAFGHAHGKLPESPAKVSKDQRDFLKQAVAGLAKDDKVICVRLALFAEMMKGKSWSLATLRAVGGTEGLGATFLEETFSASTAPPEHRLHQKAARAVLKALLPESGSEIKGHMRPYHDLLDASRYGGRPRDFDDLLRILDSEMRLITPTDPEGAEMDDESAARIDVVQQYFQLTHDYLVPSLRDWLTRKQKETRSGRAALRLTDRAAIWSTKPENRHLPSLGEYLRIRLLTNKKRWTGTQRKMMSKAGQVHGVRCGVVAALLVVASIAGVSVGRAVVAKNLVERLSTAKLVEVPAIVEELAQYRKRTDPLLQTMFAEASVGSDEKLHAALALLPVDDAKIAYLGNQLLEISSRQFRVVRDSLSPRQDRVVDTLRGIATDDTQKAQQRFQAACALAMYAADDEHWNEIDRFVADHLVNVLPSELAPWRNALRPVKDKLFIPLGAIYRNADEREQVRSFAAVTLVDYAAKDPDRLFDLLADADGFQFPLVFAKLGEHRERAIELANLELAKRQLDEASEDEKERAARRHANAAVALLRMGTPDPAWRLLKHSSDTRAGSYLIHWASPLGVDAQVIVDRINQEKDLAILEGLFLCLGEFDATLIPDTDRQLLIASLLEIYRDAPAPGLHGAARWLLHRWHQDDKINALDAELRVNEEELRVGVDAKRHWYVNTQGQTFVILDADEFSMGSSLAEQLPEKDEVLHRRRIRRRFAISATEVTKEQFTRFKELSNAQWDETDDSPQVKVSWYEAAAYCNWLSEQEGIPADQWCYEPNEQGAYAEGMRATEGYLKSNGYRLPTEAEWEFACRSGTVTSRCYGQANELLANYAWYQPGGDQTWPVQTLKPNHFGLFDMHGNALEWCHELEKAYPTRNGEIIRDVTDVEPVVDGATRVLRGGSFTNRPGGVRSANRARGFPHSREHYIGFRPARTLPEP